MDPREIYAKVTDQRRRLADLFGIDVPDDDLKLSLMEVNEGELNFRSYPARLTGREESLVRGYLQMMPSAGFYFEHEGRELLVLGLVPQNEDLWGNIVTHESTHTLFKFEGSYMIFTPDLKKVKLGRYPLGVRTIETWEEAMRQSAEDQGWRCLVDEFFPPIAQSYFHGNYSRDENWKRVNMELRRNLRSGKPFLNIEARIQSLVSHFPQIAGEIFVDLFHGDIKALIKEHAALGKLSKNELWEDYCFPLLTKGRLD